MTAPPPDPLAVCVAAARAGGAVLRDWVGRFAVTSKGPRDLVTEADFAAQREIRRVVLEAFPDHGFVGEETDGGGGQPAPGTSGHAAAAPAGSSIRSTAPPTTCTASPPGASRSRWPLRPAWRWA